MGRENKYPSLMVQIADENGVSAKMEPDGSIPVTLQDQTTPTVIIKANQVVVSSTLASAVAIDDRACTVADSTGMSLGHLLIVTSTIGHRFYYGRILTIVGNDLTLDTPFDYAFESGQKACACITDMSVDGSSTPQIFSLRAAEPEAGIDLMVDITRIKIQCETSTATSLDKFGDITALTKGLVLRRVDGEYYNIFNVKDGHEIQSIMTYSAIDAANPGQDTYGFTAQFDISGQENMGVALRISSGEDIQFIVQDNITVTRLEATLMGSVVQE